MKKFAFTSALLTLVIALASVAMAGSKNSASVSISQPVKVGDTQLQPGDYKVVWDGTGSDVQVSFMQGKKTVATAPAKLVEQGNPYDGAVDTSGNDDNSRTMNSILWKNRSLVFNPPPAVGSGQ
ncbi:MAG TPA: hypothetical protein VK473_00380 [Terriglobales bacterium]|nr:hypothetical protein [Terriglobales bacterium]